MAWNLEGLRVEGMYLGDIPVSGRVELSRVAYGGGVKHTVKPDAPVVVYGVGREFVILDNDQITRVMSN